MDLNTSQESQSMENEEPQQSQTENVVLDIEESNELQPTAASASASASASADASTSASASASTSTNAPKEQKPRKSPKVPKRKIEETELEFLNTMSNAVNEFQRNKVEKHDDDVDDFVKNIGNKLRKIQDPKVRAVAEFEIETICFKANLGMLSQQAINFNPQPIYSQSQSNISQPQPIISQPQPIISQPQPIISQGQPIHSQGIYAPQQNWIPQYDNNSVISEQGRTFAQL